MDDRNHELRAVFTQPGNVALEIGFVEIGYAEDFRFFGGSGFHRVRCVRVGDKTYLEIFAYGTVVQFTQSTIGG